MPPYVICRILGNELPPRDLPGSRMVTFDYILEHEYLPPEASRLWIINRVLDRTMLDSLKSKLESRNEKYVELAVDWNHYFRANSQGEKLSAIIGINHARNEAFRSGTKIGRFAIILDGDCCFDRDSWVETISVIEKDQLTHPERKYYAVPMERVFLESGKLSAENLGLEEPMLVMRSDSSKLFDEHIPFGNADKASLLQELGLRALGKQWYALNSEGPCIVAGKVLHICTGTRDSEADGWVRHINRLESLHLLLNQADKVAEQTFAGMGSLEVVSHRMCTFVGQLGRKLELESKRIWYRAKRNLRDSR